MGKVWRIEHLPATTKLVLLKLADNANDEGRNAYPSIDTIARVCGLNRRTVQRVVSMLKTKGWDGGRIEEEQQATHRMPAVYRIVWQDEGRQDVTPTQPVLGRQDVTPGVALDPARGGTVPPDPSVDPSVICDPKELRDIWNSNRGQCRECRFLDTTRTRHARARIREQPNREVWTKTARWLAQSTWSNGKKNGYKADFGFLVRPTTWTRAIESEFKPDKPVSNQSVKERTRVDNAQNVLRESVNIRE